MLHIVSRSVVVFLFLGLLLSGAYPLLVTALARGFVWRANGSLIERGSRIIGSELIGQPFRDPSYFHARPSAVGYGAKSPLSGGSNLGPLNVRLKRAFVARVREFYAVTPEAQGRPVPVDLVTASASGLDPHISPAAANIQAERVARERAIPPESVRALIAKHTEKPALGLLGEERVNVLRLNLDLDKNWGDAREIRLEERQTAGHRVWGPY